MITIQLKQLDECIPALDKLRQQDLPAPMAFRLAQIVRIIRPEYEQFVEQRNGIVALFGDADEQGLIRIQPDQIAAFQSKLSPLLETEIELAIQPLQVTDLGSVSLSALDAETLHFIFEE